MPTWTDLADADRRAAEPALCNGEPATPHLSCFQGRELLFTAALTPFERFGCSDALAQLEPLAQAAGTDRLVFTTSGRIHRLVDAGVGEPMPDLPAGTRIFQATFLDAHDTPVRMWTVLRAYHLLNQPGEVCELGWGREHVLDDMNPADGASSAVLARMVLPPESATGPAALRELLVRAEQAGHVVGAGLALLELVFADDPDAVAMVTAARQSDRRRAP